MDDNQLLRYSRQIMLPQVDAAGQQRLLDSRVLIIGIGGLGSPIAMYLAAAGVGTLEITDDDQVDLTNLQRQIVHDSASVGTEKVLSAAKRLHAMNPEVTLIQQAARLQGDALLHAVNAADVVVDATDNFSSRFELNRICKQQRTPLVSGAVIRMEGQVTVFDFRRADSPCYRCLYHEGGEEPQTCSETGVLAPVPGIIGSIQATEALKILLDVGTNLCGRLLLLDAATMEWREIRLKQDTDCPVCHP